MLKDIIQKILEWFRKPSEEQETEESKEEPVADLRQKQNGSGEPLWMPQVLADLERHEGYREYAYPDPLSAWGRAYPSWKHRWGRQPASVIMAELGLSKDDVAKGAPWTVGFGFTKGVKHTSRTTRGVSRERLKEEVVEHVKGLDKLVPGWRTEHSIVVQSVLANLVYNLGELRLSKFAPTLALFKTKEYAAAAARLRNTAWYKQVGVRSVELVERLETGRIRPEHLVN